MQTHKLLPRLVDLAVKAMETSIGQNSTSPTSSHSQVYLLSLKWTPDERLSKPCRDLWKWKDMTLGDGRDFFVPKPKTIKALQGLLLTQCGMTQVSVLSNCARLDIICICDHNPILDISRVLFSQMQAQKSTGALRILTQSMDMPDWGICSDALLENATLGSTELARHWDLKNDSTEILYHLCLVAAGMATRPKRPEREVVFRPFSSRDAHILLQLKRTKDIAEGNHIHQLLEYALRAGKAARNTAIVPSLSLLREYGTGDSKYSAQPPRDVLSLVTDNVIAQAINPLVHEFSQVSSQSPNVSMAICILRARIESLANTTTERAWLKKRLHQPTIDLRNGKLRSEDIQREQELIELEFNVSRRTYG